MKIVLMMLCAGCSLLTSGVPLDVYVLANADGSNVTMTRASFEEMLTAVNAIFSQVALSFG